VCAELQWLRTPVVGDALVLLFDDTALDATAATAVQAWAAAQRDLRVVSVRVVLPGAGGDVPVETMELEPFVDRTDLGEVGRVLSRVFPASEVALTRWQAHARSGSSSDFDRHIFVGALTALRSEFQPAQVWARACALALQAQSSSGQGCVVTLAYLGSFAAARRDTQLPLAMTASCLHIPLLQPFLAVAPDSSVVGFAHALFARLLLTAIMHAEGGSDSASGLCLDDIVRLHSRAGAYLKQTRGAGDQAWLRALTKSFLVDNRAPGGRFSPVLEQFVCAGWSEHNHDLLL
jgi:hypothetical protein